jgi:hypothetical protein
MSANAAEFACKNGVRSTFQTARARLAADVGMLQGVDDVDPGSAAALAGDAHDQRPVPE